MTDPEAQDSIFARFNVGWQSGAAAVVGYVPFIRWPGTPLQAMDQTKFRAVVSLLLRPEKQTTLGGVGNRVFTTDGTLAVVLLGPNQLPVGGGIPSDLLRQLAELVKGLFAGITEPSGVWYRGITVKDLPRIGDAIVKQVAVTFSYYRIG